VGAHFLLSKKRGTSEMGSRIRLAIIPTLAAVGITAILLYALNYYVRYQIRIHKIEDLTYSANTAASAVAAYGIDHDIDATDMLADELGKTTNTRITIIKHDGVVLGDSHRSIAQVRAMDNHRHRPEVEAALSKGIGIAQHFSTTLGIEMLYVAVRQQVGVDQIDLYDTTHSHKSSRERHFHVVRAAIDLGAAGKKLYPIKIAFFTVAILGIIMFLGFGLVLSNYMSRKLAKATDALEGEVEKRTHDIAMLQRLGSSLVACGSVEEAAEVIRMIIGRILPQIRGGIYTIKASRNLEELLVSWGDGWDGPKQFSPSHCWAMRKGHIHRSDEDNLGMRCQHLESQQFSHSLCIPLVAMGESLGTFTMLTDATDWQKEDIKMARTLSEQISITLASLQLRENLRQQAIRDPLTGLFNRRYLMESLFQNIGRAKRYHTQVCALMIDIDDFKRFNDAYGHDLGDLVLKRVANEIQHCTRKEDTLSRYGGEEFCLICPEMSDQYLRELAERVREHVQNLTLEIKDTHISKITISVGMAIYPEHGQNCEELLQAADEALYQAKAHGKNQAILFSAQPKGRVEYLDFN
jgi:diguanylate cyclase (GGDEF)-like protein